MKRRAFFKAGLLTGLATAIAPVAWSLGFNEFPEYEHGHALRKVFRLDLCPGEWCRRDPQNPGGRWERIRLKDARPLDVLRVEGDADERTAYWVCEKHPVKTCFKSPFISWNCAGTCWITLAQAIAQRNDMLKDWKFES